MQEKCMLRMTSTMKTRMRYRKKARKNCNKILTELKVFELSLPDFSAFSSKSRYFSSSDVSIPTDYVGQM